MSGLPRILCVDDEPQVLQGLTMHLRRHYQVVTAESGAMALLIASETGAPAVIVSDMRMPKMDGAALLKQMLALYPECSRILLTGEASTDNAAAAVNEGQIFRFLTKPCSPDDLCAAVEAGVVQHRLLTAEKLLMQETLVGCIDAMIDVLALTNPAAFGRTNRVKRLVLDLAAHCGLVNFWPLEAAAMLSQIGYISLSSDLVEKLYYGKRLSAEERRLADSAPRVAQTLLGRIPRIEPVMQILTFSQQQRTAVPNGDKLKVGADMLRAVLAYDALIVVGSDPDAAMQTLRARPGVYGAELLDDLAEVLDARTSSTQISEIWVGSLKPGMIIVDDLRTPVGTLLVPKGFEVTDAFLERKRNFDAAILQSKVRVIALPAESATG